MHVRDAEHADHDPGRDEPSANVSLESVEVETTRPAFSAGYLIRDRNLTEAALGVLQGTRSRLEDGDEYVRRLRGDTKTVNRTSLEET